MPNAVLPKCIHFNLIPNLVELVETTPKQVVIKQIEDAPRFAWCARVPAPRNNY